ncbi:hypothetical protein U1Q18_037703, partial [Sarracenia purpurea var. burkii]
MLVTVGEGGFTNFAENSGSDGALWSEWELGFPPFERRNGSTSIRTTSRAAPCSASEITHRPLLSLFESFPSISSPFSTRLTSETIPSEFPPSTH